MITLGEQAAVKGADLSLDDRSGRLRELYGVPVGGAYLARPDQHVCARWQGLSGAALAAAVHRALGNH
ncbi:FAD-dependent oxidoreductase [compost metagenome]